jgi:isopentenyldiphosphate isomerase
MPELVDVVDENDRVIGRATRKEVHSTGRLHRGVHVLVFDSGNELILPVRSSKKHLPNTYDCSVSEHVKSGESYEQALVRGLKEELNIEKIKAKKLVKFKLEYGPNNYKISQLYECRGYNHLSYNKKEVQRIEFHSLKNIEQMLLEREDSFAPWAGEILKWYLGMPSKLQVLYVFSPSDTQKPRRPEE